MAETLGPVVDTSLLPGERVAVRTRRMLSRKGRGVVRIRVFGDASLGWIDSVSLWGGCLEVFVSQGGNVKDLIHQLYPDLLVTPLAEGIRMPPHRCWEGLLLATIANQTDAEQLSRLIRVWYPASFVVACHRSISRRELHRMLDAKELGYPRPAQYTCSHEQFGGVTTTEWRFLFGARQSDNISVEFSVTRMTAGLYSRCLQTALDDTIGPTPGRRRLETGNQLPKGLSKEVVGIVDLKHKVVDGSGLAPDLSCMTTQELHHLWVFAESVFSKTKQVLRLVTLLELLAIWDYAGKIWYQGMSDYLRWELLHARLRSPPGKMLNNVVFSLCQQFLESLLPAETLEIHKVEEKDLGSPHKGILELKGIQRAKAAVADNAEIELAYWALPNETPEQTHARVVLRNFAHAWWVRNLTREASQWLSEHGNHPKDRKAIADCLRRAAGSDYWDWHRGSRLHFWRFPEECDWRREARDGVEFFHLAPPPTGLHFQNILPSSREAELQIREKILQLLIRGYLEPGRPKLVIPRFAVEKVANEEGKTVDIRAVWDSKRNGFNATIWAPKFSLPTTQDAEDLTVKWLRISVEEYLRQGSPPQDYSQDQSLFVKSYQFDHDVAQIFNNFTLHEKERKSHGVRFIHTRNDGSVEPQTMLQCCALSFGCLASPYLACQGQERIMELAEGDPGDESNPFHYCKCILNLPGSRGYDPSLPRVLLIRGDGELATRRVTFVDDLHGVGRDQTGKQAAEGARVMAFKMNYYGNQCAGRKFGPPTLIPRPWNGIMTHTDSPYPVKGTTAKKWNRGRSGLDWIWRECGLEEDLADPIAFIDSLDHWAVFIDTAELRRVAGLWIHLTEIYEEGRCFLKGFFNALEAFRHDRDLDGWRLQVSMETAQDLEIYDASRATAAADYPLLTRVTYQLVLHVDALRKLFSTEEPRVALIRPTEAKKIRYGCGDASAEGFANATQYPDLMLDDRDGLWLPEISAESSNLREALNQANHLKRDISAGRHNGCEVWQATDNAVWSAVCNKGMSSVRHLFDLLVDIKVLCHKHGVFLHCFHIAGERMIATGVDGLSRGNHDSGIALGHDLRDFFPLDVSAFDYPDNSLEEFCRGWMGDDFTEPVTPLDWFYKAQKPGIHLIAPPPAAAVHALKEIARGRHKRPYHLTHVIMIPRLLYQEEWRTRFQKECDVWFTMQTGKYWPHSAYEPLLVGPDLGYSGWKGTKWWQLAGPCQKCQRRVTYESGIICANYGVIRGRSFKKCEGMWCGSCFVPSSLDPCDIKLPEDFTGATIDELGEQDRFMQARPGDHLCLSFQCPNCHSQNIRGRDLAVRENIADACFESLCIRAQLDALWSRSRDTIKNHVREARYMVRYGASLSFSPMPPLGPFKLGQHNGMLQAIMLEMRAMEAGRRQATVQFGTARMIRATTTVLWEASPASGGDITLSSGKKDGRYIATLCPSENRWYSHFSLGVSVRMGDVVHQDRAYTLEIVHAVIELFETQFQEQGFDMPTHDFEAALFFIISCVGGFRGYETVWTNLGALRYEVEYCEEIDDYSGVSWPVTGRFKNEHGSWNHYMIPIAGVTGSGIRVFEWTQRIISCMRRIGRVGGWLFRKNNGVDRALACDYADNIYQKLEHLQETTNLIEPGCNVREDYGMQRSGRRFFDTQCINMKVPTRDIEFQCRWRTDRTKGGMTVKRSMLHTYAEVRNMKATLLRPSQAL